MSTIPRDIEYERALTHEACLTVVDPTDLIELSEARAHRLSGQYVDDSSRIRLGMNRPREAREEILDCRNHLLYHMQERELNADEYHDCMLALRHMGILFDVLKRLDQ